MVGLTNSRATRVLPIFGWLKTNGGDSWPRRLLTMADGVADISECGSILSIDLELEREVPATASRLAWMLKNVDRLVHSDGRLWGALRQRVADRVRVEEALASLAAEKVEIPRDLVLEGNTHADCLIDCEHVLIWIEGKRDDWLSQSTKWDVTRDQLARNVEAA